MLRHIGLHRPEERCDRVRSGSALEGVPQHIAELGHRQRRDAVLQVADAVDVLVQRGCPDAQAVSESSEAILNQR